MERLSLMLITAFVLAAGATPLARRAAASLGLMDMPAPRKVHARPTPLMGGVAIYVAFLAALLLFGDRFYVRQMVGILVGRPSARLPACWMIARAWVWASGWWRRWRPWRFCC